MSKKEMIPAIKKAGKLKINLADINRFERTHEVIKAKFVSERGVEYYRYYHTPQEFTQGVIFANRFKSKLIAYFCRINLTENTKVVVEK